VAKLVLVRHGESEWNAVSKWTGLTDVDLSQKGREEALRTGAALKEFKFQKLFTSAQKRAQNTLKLICKQCQINELPIVKDSALNERDYGVYTGKDKWQVQEEVGEEQFHKIRRGWETKIPKGENLKQVYERVAPYYRANILPELKAGNNVLVVAHGNSLRALIKHLEDLSIKEVEDLEMPFNYVVVYDIDKNGKVTHKEVRVVDPQQPLSQ